VSRLFSIAKIAAFVAIAVAPLAALAIFGAASPYGQKPLAAFPTLASVATGKTGSLDNFGRAVLDRSPATELAILIKNLAGYRATNYVDTNTIVSGLDGWLFFKEEFACLDAKQLAAGLQQIDSMIQVAKASGLELIVGISPDKGSIYPEKLHPLAHRYWSCKLQNSHLWRSLLAQHPDILDHAVPILAEKERDPKAKLYFYTDTHWTPYGAAWAFRQLIDAASGHRGGIALPDPHRTGEMLERPTDMANQMLLLPGAEAYDKIDMSVEGDLARVANAPMRKTIVLHDSFYYVLRDSLAMNFPGIRFYHLESEIAQYSPVLEDADRIVVNSVERAFLGRTAAGGTLSWQSPLGRAILARCEAKPDCQLALANLKF
jgi:hypothetical protein